MAFTIHAFRDGHFMKTLRLRPHAAADRARNLVDQGWRVHITDEAGRHYSFDAPDGRELLDIRRAAVSKETQEDAAGG